MEPFELAGGEGNGLTLRDILKYIWEYVVLKCMYYKRM